MKTTNQQQLEKYYEAKLDTFWTGFDMKGEEMDSTFFHCE